MHNIFLLLTQAAQFEFKIDAHFLQHLINKSSKKRPLEKPVLGHNLLK